MQAQIIKTHSLTILTYLALAALFVPTFYKLFSYGWRQADYSHGPLILGAFLWLLWREKKFISMPTDTKFHLSYLCVILFGLFCYVMGSIHKALLVESFSIIPIFIGTTGFLLGRQALAMVLFPAMFLVFLIPPPLFFIDMVTSPLKLIVAKTSEIFLHIAGYTINRNGVLLFIGDYTIVVGDACSGLRSLVSLLAVGALYAYLQNISNLKKAFLFLSIIPISIIANIIRLIVLALITYYYGESAGQGFFHNFSGLLLFIIAIGCLVLIDVFLNRKTVYADNR
ncbi:MAG: exosortase [Nitrospirae bacterium]|nr:exosortase [Nitrospirota bacterium]